MSVSQRVTQNDDLSMCDRGGENEYGREKRSAIANRPLSKSTY